MGTGNEWGDEDGVDDGDDVDDINDNAKDAFEYAKSSAVNINNKSWGRMSNAISMSTFLCFFISAENQRKQNCILFDLVMDLYNKM